MRLFVAEKRDQALAIADAIMPTDHQIIEPLSIICGDDVITWTNGHLYEQAPPEYYDPKYRKWELKDLPIIPKRWEILPIKGKEQHIATIHQLIATADRIVHACDPDREGQLIGDEVLAKAPTVPAVDNALRLWPDGLDEIGIRRAIAEMRPNSEYRGLTKAALGRARNDWAYGINLSRKCNIDGRRAGYSSKFNVGRVKTPTLALIVSRDQEIDSFRAVPYFTVLATFAHANGDIKSVWLPREGLPGVDAKHRVTDRLLAEATAAKVDRQPGRVAVVNQSPETDMPPLPLDLTALQAQANERAGLTAKQTLAAAQSLYERHRVITYPRTACRYLNERDHKDAANVLLAIAKNDTAKSSFCQKADLSIKSRAWDNARAGAAKSHTAIVPTTRQANLSALSTHEQVVYDLVCRAYLAQFYPPAEYIALTITIKIANEIFESRQRNETTAGWKLLYPPTKGTVTTTPIPEMEPGDTVHCTKTDIQTKETEPPRHFTPGTLMTAMKNIHRFMPGADQDTKKRMAAIGIGTVATRAEIIETLIEQDKFVELHKNYLISTSAGRQEINALRSYDQLVKPDLTAENETLLEKIEHGDFSLEQFMKTQADILKNLLVTIRIQPNPNGNQGAKRGAQISKDRRRPADAPHIVA